MFKKILGFIIIFSMLIGSYQLASATPNSFAHKINTTQVKLITLAKANTCNSSKGMLLLIKSCKTGMPDSKNLTDDGLLAISSKLNFNSDNKKLKPYNLFLAYSSPANAIYQPPRNSHYTLI